MNLRINLNLHKNVKIMLFLAKLFSKTANCFLKWPIFAVSVKGEI